jgi:hypothetical protein
LKILAGEAAEDAVFLILYALGPPLVRMPGQNMSP